LPIPLYVRLREVFPRGVVDTSESPGEAFSPDLAALTTEVLQPKLGVNTNPLPGLVPAIWEQGGELLLLLDGLNEIPPAPGDRSQQPSQRADRIDRLVAEISQRARAAVGGARVVIASREPEQIPELGEVVERLAGRGAGREGAVSVP